VLPGDLGHTVGFPAASSAEVSMSVTDDRTADRSKKTASRSSGVWGPGRASLAEKTLRTDRWWIAPLTTFTVFSAFIVYATWRAFDMRDYLAGDYLSPFYSPCLTNKCGAAADFGTPFGGFPLSAALIILIFPLGFRMTCYYYRKSYYRAFWLSPPACAVAEPHTKYTGETRLPLILNNAHRYFWYAAVVVGVILTYDTVLSFQDFGVRGHGSGHVGIGSLIMVVNVVLIWAYTLSCHSCRHIAGGRLKHFSQHPVRYRFWTFVSKLNTRHMMLAWITLGTLALTDAYVMCISAGWFPDLRFVG
jgi:hypothetical protein